MSRKEFIQDDRNIKKGKNVRQHREEGMRRPREDLCHHRATLVALLILCVPLYLGMFLCTQLSLHVLG